MVSWRKIPAFCAEQEINMLKILECVPNISEGRDPAIVQVCCDAVRSVAGVTLMDYSSDENHNRSVLSFLGAPEAVVEAAVRLAKVAAERIDLRVHRGEHPRMGAVDVIPFIPLRGMDVEEAVTCSRTAAERIWAEAGIPVYYYEDSATAEHRKNLAHVRRGEFEGLAEKTRLPEWQPDVGQGYHPSAGAVAVGARFPLIAFNINLTTDDVSVADRIARKVRASGGGFPCVKALGIMLQSRKVAQDSMNLTNYTVTPIYRVVEAVRAEAKALGADILCTELIGLTPMQALADSAAYYLQLEEYDFHRQVLENHLLEE